jgi:uncharacterized protein YbaP (TraB family)
LRLGDGMRKFVWLAVLAVFGVSGAQAPAAKMQATPAMWKVKGVHGTVYLFGSVHVMKPEVEWETAKVKAALVASDTVYLEIKDVDEEAMKAMQPLVMRIGMDMEHPLSTKVPKADVDLMDKEVKELGLPGEQAFEMMRPWLAYVTLSALPALKAGYQQDGGVDVKVGAEAAGGNKRVLGFETAEEQLHYLADMPEAQQVKMLHKTLVDMPKSTKEMADMIADWTHGDVDKIAAMENDEMKADYPELYQTLLVKRNEKFTGVLAGLLKDPGTGTVFVTIGAAHLAGPDSVMKMLEKKGYRAERVE